jgi:hypothetical protein
MEWHPPDITPDDAPVAGHARPAAYVEAATYADALVAWRTPEDVDAWIGARFVYDRSRAVLLSESARARAAAPPVRTPDAFFATPQGVCVDVARFGVESVKAIDPTLQPAYLMLEFEPVVVGGETLRRHWLATFRRDGAWWFFADSKRPGHVAGPFASVQAFVDEYAAFRQRRVVAWRELPTFERRVRERAPRRPAPTGG